MFLWFWIGNYSHCYISVILSISFIIITATKNISMSFVQKTCLLWINKSIFRSSSFLSFLCNLIIYYIVTLWLITSFWLRWIKKRGWIMRHDYFALREFENKISYKIRFKRNEKKKLYKISCHDGIENFIDLILL